MSFPKISIITPSFNQGQYLEQTIDSVLSQGYPNLEYMVVDGGSTDNSAEIIRKYEKHLTWWVSEKDNGQSHAINKGLRRATGQIINWINSDDYYEPHALKSVVEAFENPQVTMASFRANVIGLQNRISRGTDIFRESLPKTIAYTRIDQPETFFRSEAVAKMGLLNENLHYCMDKEWLLRYFLHFGIEGAINVDNVILNFRYHEDSKSVSANDKFEVEADCIYSQYAKNVGHERAFKWLSKSCQSSDEIELEIPHTSLLEKYGLSILDYTMFKRFIETYEKLDKQNALEIERCINYDSLSIHDQKQIKLLVSRIRHIPRSLLSFFRRLKRVGV